MSSPGSKSSRKQQSISKLQRQSLSMTTSEQGLSGVVGQTGQRTSTPPCVPTLQRLMLEVFQAVREYRDPSGRQLSNLYMKLPNRAELPAYYEFIKSPIEMQTIAKQLLQGRYSDFEEFMSDLYLMFDNSCRFNEPDSQIYKDALVLHRVGLTKRGLLLSSVAASNPSVSVPGLSPAHPPDVAAGIRRLLTSLHNAMLTACDAEGRGLVDSLIAGDGTELSPTSATAARLAALHRAVAVGAYRRLDRLQSDWLEVLRRARISDEISDDPATPTPQQRHDAAELARRWVRLRDSVCRKQSIPQTEATDSQNFTGHFQVISSAMTYTEAALKRDLKDEVETFQSVIFGDEDGEEDLTQLREGEVEISSVEVRGTVYGVGDYVYVEPLRPAGMTFQIGRITRIFKTGQTSAQTCPEAVPIDSSANSEAEVGLSGARPSVSVRVARYWRPNEAKPCRRRRLLAAEVFRTAEGETVPSSKLLGHCLVLPISQFIRYRAKNVDERDVFVCESQFSIAGRFFVKLRRWGVQTPSGVELEERPVPFVPTRLPPNEPLESALEQLNTSSFSCMNFPLPKPNQTVIIDDRSGSDGTIVYEQYVHENGFTVKLGDGLYVSPPNNTTERHFVRLDKIWKNTELNSVFFSGTRLLPPSAVNHLPSRVFYPREVIVKTDEQPIYPLAAALGKCFIMHSSDYSIARPTEYKEVDVYVYESKYSAESDSFQICRGLKKYTYSNDALEDEFFVFPQPLVPRKEASPLLSEASRSPLSIDQLNRPTSAALACVVASSNGVSTPTEAPGQWLSDTPRSAVTPGKTGAPTLDAGQLAFMEAGLDRSGKKRKLRKPPSGYVIYAGEIRKKLLQDRPDAPFGEISREVGLMWRQMPAQERDLYEKKAQVIKRRMEEEEVQAKARQLLLQDQQRQAQQQRDPIGPVSHEPSLLGREPGVSMVSQSSQAVTMVPGQQQPSAMQFFQTPTGQVIQVMHSSSVAATQGCGLRAPHQITGTLVSQPHTGDTTTHLSGALLSTPSSVPAGIQQIVGAHQLPASTNQQVLYQFTGHHPVPCGSGMPSGSVNIGGNAVGAQPVIFAHHMGQQAISMPCDQFSGQTQHHYAPSTGGLVQARQPMIAIQQQQPCMQILHQMPASTGPGIGHQGLSASTSNLQTGPQLSGSHPNMHGIFLTQAPTRPPSPLFVSVPPRTSRVLHSEIYQRYIDRLRRNAPTLSDWRKQATLTPENAPPLSHQQQQTLAASFIDNPHLHAHHGGLADAIWNLRDNLLKDTLNIRARSLGVEEL